VSEIKLVNGLREIERMLRKLMAVLLFGSSIYLTGCTTIDVGNVGIEVSKMGPSRGVQDVTIKSGLVFYNPITTTIKEYPYSVKRVVWTHDVNEGNPRDESITFTTSNSAVVNCDVASSIQLAVNSAPYFTFRADDFNSFVDGFYRDAVRKQMNNVAGKYTVEQVMGDNGKMIDDVEAAVQKQMNPYGITVTNLSFTGACRPPDAVMQSINAKLAQEQRALQTQNEIAQVEAEAKKREADAQGIAQSNLIMAQADATANKLRSESLTPAILQLEAIKRWDGHLSQVSGGGSNLINIK
jgi:regulator of protease activity HflC (stomatin/prohibitin superfamily)